MKDHLELIDDLFALNQQTTALILVLNDEEALQSCTTVTLANCLWLVFAQLERMHAALDAMQDTPAFARKGASQ